MERTIMPDLSFLEEMTIPRKAIAPPKYDYQKALRLMREERENTLRRTQQGLGFQYIVGMDYRYDVLNIDFIRSQR